MSFIGPIQLLFEQLPVFLLVLFRIGGLITAAPVLGSLAIPIRIKAMTALLITLAVFPIVPPAVTVVNNLASLVLGVASEMVIGLAMGFILSLLFVGVQLGATLIGQQMGLGYAQLVDPMSQITTNVLSQFYLLLTTIIYILLGGHLVLIGALIKTFQSIPLMAALSNASIFPTLVETFIAVLSGAFLLGVRIAGPALIAIFLATLALGFISRTMPQLNILAAGFPIRIVLSMILLITSLGTVVWLFENSLDGVFGYVTQFILAI